MPCSSMYYVFHAILILELLTVGVDFYNMYLRAPAERSWKSLRDVLQLQALPAQLTVLLNHFLIKAFYL